VCKTYAPALTRSAGGPEEPNPLGVGRGCLEGRHTLAFERCAITATP
jgi:hypothetical protein